MSEENIVQVKGNYAGEVFTLDKDTGLVTFTISSPVLIKQWNEALQWLPVKSISNDSIDRSWFNYLTLELTTGEVVRLTDEGAVAGTTCMCKGKEYLSIGEWS